MYSVNDARIDTQQQTLFSFGKQVFYKLYQRTSKMFPIKYFLSKCGSLSLVVRMINGMRLCHFSWEEEARIRVALPWESTLPSWGAICTINDGLFLEQFCSKDEVFVPSSRLYQPPCLPQRMCWDIHIAEWVLIYYLLLPKRLIDQYLYWDLLLPFISLYDD